MLIIADLADCIEGDFLPVDFGMGGDFAGNDDKVGRGQRFTGNTAVGILHQTGIENGIRDLIADLIGMSFRNGFRGENMFRTDLAHNKNSFERK